MNRYRLNQFFRNNSSTILVVLAVGGLAGTIISTVKATPKALQSIEEAKEEKGEELTKMETLQVTWKHYIPVAVWAAGTVGCMLSASVLNRRAQAMFTSGYAMLNRFHKSYRNKVIERYGEEVDQEICHEIAREYPDHHFPLNYPDQKMVFYDSDSDTYFTRYEREIMDAEYHLNRNFVMRGYANLNEFYYFLGLPPTEYGENVGWSMSDGYYWIDFAHRLRSKERGEMIYEIIAIFPPDEEYLREWE